MASRRHDSTAKVKPHNALYERLATLSLLPDVAGMRGVIHPAMSASTQAEQARRRRPTCQAPASHQAGDLARQRVGTRATNHRGDLAEPLEFAADESFDLVV